VKASRSLTETRERLGLKGRGRVSLHIDRLNLSTAHWSAQSLGRRGRSRSWSDDDLRVELPHATSLTDLLVRLGLSHENSYSRSLVRMQIKNLDLDCSHFKDWSHLKGKPLHSLLRKGVQVHCGHLKARLIRAGKLEYRCDNCGNDGTWQGRKLILELHHRNGATSDNRLKNLCLFCPNCHSQTDTYKGRNRAS